MKIARLGVAAQLGFHRGERHSEGVCEGLFSGLALAEKFGVSREPGTKDLVVAGHEIIREEPGFGVKHALAAGFVVLGRIVGDFKEFVQGHELFSREGLQVAIDGTRDFDVVAAGNESGINLGHAFLEPERPDFVVVAKEEMGVFMEDDVHVWRIGIGQREDDEVFVAAAREEASEISGLALIEGQERNHVVVIGKRQDDNGRGGGRIFSGEHGVGALKLFEAAHEAIGVGHVAATENVEMGAADDEPGALLKWRGRGVFCLGEGGIAKQNGKGKQQTAHLYNLNATAVSGKEWEFTIYEWQRW